MYYGYHSTKLLLFKSVVHRDQVETFLIVLYNEITCWLTGYSKEQIDEFLIKDIEYGEFFLNAPQLNENRKKITGKICGIRVEEIEEPLMQEIRYLDKLVDELAKGKSLDKILRK